MTKLDELKKLVEGNGFKAKAKKLVKAIESKLKICTVEWLYDDRYGDIYIVSPEKDFTGKDTQAECKIIVKETKKIFGEAYTDYNKKSEWEKRDDGTYSFMAYSGE